MQAILQARMTSSRLPGKVLMPVLGRPIISYNLERIRNAATIDQVVLAATNSSEDDALVRWAEREDVSVFRGSEEDVLDRTYRCAREFNMEVFAKFTADNPLIDPAVIDEVINAYLKSPDDYDYFSNNHPPTWQDGQEVEIIRKAALETAWRESDQSFQREHVTPFIWDQPERFRIGNLARDDDRWYHQYRWTLDYPEDYEFIKRVFEELYPRQPRFATADLMALLDLRSEIRALNAGRMGYVWYREHLGGLQTVTGNGHLSSE
jgi:spore coat polysaccharide biosynthesis protein SpsF